VPKSFAVHLDGPPTIQIRKGVVKVIDHTSGARIERAMAVADLEEYVRRGKRALERFATGDRDITESG
jgi:hypothetical protein